MLITKNSINFDKKFKILTIWVLSAAYLRSRAQCGALEQLCGFRIQLQLQYWNIFCRPLKQDKDFLLFISILYGVFIYEVVIIFELVLFLVSSTPTSTYTELSLELISFYLTTHPPNQSSSWTPTSTPNFDKGAIF